MRKITLSEEQFEAIRFAMDDVNEAYSTYKMIGDDADEDEVKYENRVRHYGKLIMELLNGQFKD